VPRRSLVPAAAFRDLPQLDVAPRPPARYTRGAPAPSVQQAMLTPSAVRAYWTCASKGSVVIQMGTARQDHELLRRDVPGALQGWAGG
jgi:hypothetical protein